MGTVVSNRAFQGFRPDSSNLETPHIDLATAATPQTLFQSEDPGLELPKSSLPSVLSCVSWLGNWTFISSKLERDPNIPPVGTKAAKGQIMKLPFT